MLPFIARTFFHIQERLLGRRSFAILGKLRDSERWPRERLEQLRLARLQAIVRGAWEHTPYWHEVMARAGIAPDDVRSPDDLRRLPLLEKATIRQRREEMVWREEGRRVTLVRTSGSTNEALQFYTSSTREAHINAARMRGHLSIGVAPGDKELYYWAAPLELNVQNRLRRIRDALRNDAFTSGMQLTPEMVPQHLKKWLAWRPNCIFSYVSSISLLARMARQGGVDMTPLRDRGLRGIVTTSELLADNRRLVGEVFDVPVYDSYGLREGGLIGHECNRFTMHSVDEQLILETIDPRSGQLTGGEGELVVTMLASHVMPVIRYRTGDLVSLSRRPCPCGRTLGSVSMSGGRILEYLVTSEGRWISALSVIYTCKYMPGLRQLQARQERLGQVRLLVATEPGFPSDGLERIRTAIRARMGGQDEIVMQIVDEIPPAPSGKQLTIISKVARDLLARDRFRVPQREEVHELRE